MSLLVASKTIMGEWAFTEGSHLTTRPVTPYGTTVTPGNNTYGTAVQIGADLTQDAWAILIGVNGIGAAGEARDSLTQIGFDLDGGATFPATPDRYNSISLYTSMAADYDSEGPGVQYYFPLRLPSGTSIMARGSVNNATVGTQNVWWRTWGRPKYPEATRAGCYVESLGIVAASSSGTTVTPGTTSEGTAVSLGTLNANAPCWYWEGMLGVNDATTVARAYHFDLLRDSAAGPVILENGYVLTQSNENLVKPSCLTINPIADVPGGTEIFGRAQCSAGLNAAEAMAAFGCGG